MREYNLVSHLFQFLVCNVVGFIISPRAFLLNVLFPSSEPKSKPSRKPAVNRRQALLTILVLDSEDGGYMFPRNFYGVYRTAWRHNLEVPTLHSHQSENLISNENIAISGPQKREKEREWQEAEVNIRGAS
jgi:hypothetical protein